MPVFPTEWGEAGEMEQTKKKKESGRHKLQLVEEAKRLTPACVFSWA